MPAHLRRVTPALLLLAFAPLACERAGGDAHLALQDLPQPAQEIAEPFSTVLGATEFRPGQLLVVDGTEAAVTLVDFATGARTMLGRNGAGPGEYTVPGGVLRLPGDTILVLDVGGSGGGAARLVKFLPDLTAGTTGTMMLLNTQDTTVIQGTMFPGAEGQVYSTSIKLTFGPTGPVPSDTMRIVRFGLQPTPVFTTLGSIRTPQTGQPERRVEQTAIKIKAPFSGLVKADAWTAFPDGRIAIIRGEGYTIEFIGSDGQATAPVAIPYERIPVAEADKEAELDAVRRQLADVMVLVRRSLPPNFTIDIEIIPPPEWPTEYPPVAAIVAHPAPNGDVWVRRAVPARLDREQWDVIDPTGTLVARWQLPPQTTLVTVGDGVVYTSRADEDDLRYVQRVELPAR